MSAETDHLILSELSSRSANGLDVAVLLQQCDTAAIVTGGDREIDQSWPTDGQDFRIAA